MKTLVCFSGGMDSTTLLIDTIQKKGLENVQAIGFTYGSKHNPFELEARERLRARIGFRLEEWNLEDLFDRFDSDLLESGGEIPEGHYEQDNMSQTIVPGRNMIFAALLGGYAMSKGFDSIKLGIHSGDHAIYPDCRPGFAAAMRLALLEATDNKVSMEAPMISMDKTSIIKHGLRIDVPYELTRTCYKSQGVACGRCGACQERLEAFRNNGIEDPLEYEFRGVLPKTE